MTGGQDVQLDQPGPDESKGASNIAACLEIGVTVNLYKFGSAQLSMCYDQVRDPHV